MVPLEWVKPPALRPGAVVGVTAPSGPVRADRLVAGISCLRAAGFEIALAPHCLARQPFLAGPDPVRVADFNGMLRDPGIDAVIVARGGYGAMRILPCCDWSPLRRRPKAVVGFSDATALHVGMASAGLVSFHGPVVEAGPEGMPPADLAGLVRALCGRGPLGLLTLPSEADRPVVLHPGRAAGRLLGGNLTLLAATTGTPWELDTTGCLLLLEDVGESPYRLDRCLTQLRLAGKLQAAAGFLIGELIACEGPPGSPSPLEVVAERLVPLGKPCLANLPLGHGRLHLTLPLGVQGLLDADAGEVRVMESAVQ